MHNKNGHFEPENRTSSSKTCSPDPGYVTVMHEQTLWGWTTIFPAAAPRPGPIWTSRDLKLSAVWQFQPV